MAKKPWTDPFPNLGCPGIARQFAATEVPTPPSTVLTPGDTGAAQGKARRASPATGTRLIGEAPMKRSKGHGRVVLPKVIKASELVLAPPALGKSTAKLPKSKGGRPRTIGDDKPWMKAGVSRASWYRRQGKSG